MPSSDDLKRLIAVLHDGEQFYADAADLASESEHRALFRSMAGAKARMAGDLAGLLLPAERIERIDGTWTGKIRECYARSRALLSVDKDAVFINELEAAEDRVLAAFRECLSTTRQRKVRKVLEQEYPHALATHDHMSALKRSMHAR